MDLVFALAINGLVWGLIIALIALGLSIIFGLLDVINVAHGDFFMVGTVVGLIVAERTGSFWLALAIVPLIGFLLGLVVERFVIRPSARLASLTIVTTFGLSMILQEGVRATFGAQPRRMAAPVQGTVPLFGVDYEIYRLVAALFSVACLLLFFVFLNRTKLGTWIRAVRHDHETATALGIPVVRVCAFTFALGTALALVGGAIAAPITTVEFRTGVDILPFCFMAVVIGGLGNLQGTIAAAVLLSVMEGLVTSVADPTMARVASLAVMCAVLLVRPHGLFAGATR
ncbi:high-affinity branched-chain amino acid transport system permease protein LivH [Variibacter gotjawalensis]|uniref:High-affinity branched-chain amino acid transport system permease protein LivH n=1 Tax=Variibacter gotjawalensis TaxID=1333996 RepID=A0A0S3Q046_9BRAD|nr:branched-chain amino acid ABC transporter permease [Variibacter gotjawalensis]NIK47380.1 branched-chain amino acid transport system permease protein [Variibacter gotjawalensis]RZS49276.1 amino acid/amide ABC transporter membrane protein 1 (HAAT family) [Variibacter gotjawalensis]BAT61540.1 high-affinity branched-chain amino acid transport system permease protein LivH [Variibacter gotjawalensis]